MLGETLPAGIIQFDEFELDLGRYELRRGDRVVKLEKTPMELLILLVENQGQLVTREDIIQRLWGDNVFVDTRHGINTAVHKLRSALRDDSEQPRILETVVGKGYRLVAVTVASSPVLPSASVTIPVAKAGRKAQASAQENRRSRKRSASIWAAGITVTASVVLAFFLIPSGLRDRILTGQGSIRSLAVLPFENLSGDSSKDYVADGFTDELTTDLAERTRILVVSRTSVMRYKGSRKPLPEIAHELKVDAIVEGSVVLSDEQVRITAQLIRASTDRHLWAHSYERERKDLFSIQSDVAATIAVLVRANTETSGSSSTRVPPRPRYNPATYELFLECRNLQKTGTEESESQAIQCYRHILTLDPNSADAYAELAYCYFAVDPSKARDPAIKAVELDESLPEPHIALAHWKQFVRDPEGAEREFRRALELNPSSAEAHIYYADALVAAGQKERAIAEARIAEQLDPFSASNATLSGRVFFMAGQFDQALKEEISALDLDPSHSRARYWLGYAYEQKGMYKEAIAEYEKALPDFDQGLMLAAIGRSLLLGGESKKAAEVRDKIAHFPGDGVWPPYDAALFYAVSGDNNRAFESLEKDLKQNNGWTLYMKVDPRLSPLRSDPRFQALVKRAGLPIAATN